MNFRREGNESRGVNSSDPLLETERSKIVVKYKFPLCRHVMAVREALHAEYGQLLCPKCVTRTTSLRNNDFSTEEMEHFDTRSNGSRSSASNAETSDSEFTEVSQGHAASNMCARNNLTEPSTDNVALEEGQQPNNQQSDVEKASGSTTPNEEPDRTVSRKRTDLEQLGGYQMLHEGQHATGSDEMSTSIQGNESASTMTFGEECRPVSEMDLIAGRPQSPQLSTEDTSGHSICNGGDGNALPQGDQVELVDRMERPEHQPFPLQECGIQVNVLSVPTQETELFRSQELGTRQTFHQGYTWNHPLQEMEQPALRRPRETSGLLACHQPRDDDSVNVVSSLGRIQQHIEHGCERQEIRLWQGQLDRSASQKAVRNKQNPRETYFIVKYTNVEQFRQADDNGLAPAVFGPAIDSDSFEYKFGVRMYPNGVGDGRGRYVAIFVHMMEGEHDDFLTWPYAGRITLSVLDRNGQRHNDISHTLQAKPMLAAFQRPREAICPIGYGLIYFARIELFFGPQFVKKR